MFLGGALHAQQPDTLIKKLDSAREKTNKDPHDNVIKQEAYNETTALTFKNYFVLLGSDAKQQLTKPFHMSRKEWRGLAIGTITIAALTFADEPIQRNMLDIRNKNPSLQNISKFVTNTGGPYEAITLSALATYGFFFKNEKLKTSALLASQSYLISAVTHSIFKVFSGRQRPFFYDPNSVEVEPKFNGPFHKSFTDKNGKKIGSSFPSGHTSGAFAAATVFAMEYRDRPWVKILAYGSASLIGASRIAENKHWFTDVLTGAALGYFTGMQVVNNYHRYASIQNANKKKGTVLFHLNYDFGTFMPGVTYTFR